MGKEMGRQVRRRKKEQATAERLGGIGRGKGTTLRIFVMESGCMQFGVAG